MIVIIKYEDTNDESHDVAEDLASALLAYWNALQQNAQAPIPDDLLTALSEAGIDVRWGFVIDIVIRQDVDSGETTIDAAIFGISSSSDPVSPAVPIDADSRRTAVPGQPVSRQN